MILSNGGRPAPVRLNKVIPRTETSAETGLSAEQAEERLQNGYGNTRPDPPTKTVGQIIKSNVFTYFNLIFFVLAACVLAVGSYNDLTFLPVVIANILIGIVQELRSKRTMDKLSFIAAPRATVIRGGAETVIPAEDAVLDDVAVFRAGEQIYADAVVLAGECQVNESLITGEADEITKQPGDGLLSGSYVVSGECRARLDKVGLESFVSRLTLEAKKTKKTQQSEMMRSLTRLVQIIGIIIIPLGIAMFLQQKVALGREMQESVVSTVAALIGMIPEGLYLLTSIALTVGIMRLARKRTLVHEMGCIETLARVDTLCADKTGTVTENKMVVKDVVLLCEDRFNDADIRMIMSDYVGNMGADNDTMASLRKYFSGEIRQTAVKTMPFISARKYGGVSYAPDESYLLGGPEMILGDSYELVRERVEEFSAQGCRVLLLALYDGDMEKELAAEGLMPQGVNVKVISGDNPITVSHVAQEAGIPGSENYVDARELNTERKIQRAVREYTVFGRVTPDRKRRLVRALKADGHTVAMTGDGVNDVLALRDADCSVAMASGSDLACRVSQIVLLDSDFSAMPSVVMEGRRVINNIERSASLFLVKNIFSLILSLLTIIFALSYPLTPSQLSLVNVMTIGIPSFVLALEPNRSLVKGHFLRNVLRNAAPAGLTDAIVILAAMFVCPLLGATEEQISTMVTMIMGCVGLMMLFKVSRPFNRMRLALIILMAVGFFGAAILLPSLFNLVKLPFKYVALTAGFAAVSAPIMLLLSWLLRPRQRNVKKDRRKQKNDPYSF